MCSSLLCARQAGGRLEVGGSLTGGRLDAGWRRHRLRIYSFFVFWPSDFAVHNLNQAHRLQCATNLTSFSRARDMCGHVRAACARRCSKEFHVICRVRGGLIDTLFSNASSYHVRLDKNAATPHVCTCGVCMSKPSSLRNVHMGFAEFEED